MGAPARATAGTVGRILASMLSMAVEDEILAGNPATKLGRALKLSAGGRATSVKAMDEEQLGRFLEAARTREATYYPLFLVAALGGLRRGELLGTPVG